LEVIGVEVEVGGAHARLSRAPHLVLPHRHRAAPAIEFP
jgi:hypothetical protein